MSNTTVKFLLVDDLEENLLALDGLLRRKGVELFKANSGPTALELLLQHDFALAIIDVQMPEMSGFELAELMRGTERTRRVPIIFVTAGTLDMQRRFRGYEAGAVDFLFKPIEAHVLRSKADVFFDLYQQRQEVARQRDELQESAKALEAARDKATAANLAKDRFLAVLSHELRTPLSPVLMAASAMEDDSSLSPDLRETMGMIHRNMQIEARLIDDLLDVSRVPNGKLPLINEPVNLHTVVRHAVDTCAGDAQLKELEVTVTLDAFHDEITGDAARLQQVFWNLLKNAIKFTPARGRITVTSENVVAQSVCITIQDTGLGIVPSALPRIFDAFEQADVEITRQFGGLGLGLAICKGIIESHGGKISAVSAGRGKGATFTVELPLAHGSLASSHEPASHNRVDDRTRNQSLRVLLVEDHADTAAVLCRMLRMEGFHVEAAQTAKGALALAMAQPFDVVVSDVGLPDMSGYELIKEMKKHFDFYAIAMSGYGMDDDVRQGREAGFSVHLVKPVDMGQLCKAIMQVSRKG